MKYEINYKVTFNTGSKEITKKKSYITDSYEFTEKEDHKAIRFFEEGKKKATIINIEKLPHWTALEVIITEATTGRRIETFN